MESWDRIRQLLGPRSIAVRKDGDTASLCHWKLESLDKTEDCIILGLFLLKLYSNMMWPTDCHRQTGKNLLIATLY